MKPAGFFFAVGRDRTAHREAWVVARNSFCCNRLSERALRESDEL